MHIAKKTGRLMPNFADHAFSQGFSVQRHDLAKAPELSAVVSGFLTRKEKAAWLGVAKSSTRSLREFRSTVSGDHPIFGVYDSAEPDNPAHAEIACTKYQIEDADRLEAYAEIFRSFGSGELLARENYFGGAVWAGLSSDHRARPIDKFVDQTAMH
jgi:hypothetical protein